MKHIVRLGLAALLGTLGIFAPVQAQTNLQAPTNLVAGGSGQDLVLTWTDNSTGESGYKIDLVETNGSTTNLLRGTTPNQTSFNRSFTRTGTTTLRVYAYANNIANGPQASVTFNLPLSAPTPTPTPPPALDLTPPDDLTAIRNPQTLAVSLSWTDRATGETGYIIQRKQSKGSFIGNFETISVGTTPNQQSYLDTTAPNLTISLRYRVIAYKAGPPSNEAPAVTPTPTPTPILTERISVSSAEVQGNDKSGDFNFSGRGISSDGRFVCVDSIATNLVSGDTNGLRDVFVRDVTSGTTERVSVSNSGAQGTGVSDNTYGSGVSSISGDGRYVTFQSSSPNLVTGDSNGSSDIFVRDRQSGTTTLLSVDSSGVQGNGGSQLPFISSNGRFVAFYSLASNLVTGDTNSSGDYFVRDLVAGTTERVNLGSAGAQSNAASETNSNVVLSADGRFAAFISSATNLVPSDTNNVADIFVRDRQTATTARVSFQDNGTQRTSASVIPSISADGRYVTYNDFQGTIIVYDRQTATQRSFVGYGTGVISGNGRFLAFNSTNTTLVSGDTNGVADILVLDLSNSAIALVSRTSTGAQANARSISPAISDDGRFITYSSDATNLVPGDTNGIVDTFRSVNPLAP